MTRTLRLSRCATTLSACASALALALTLLLAPALPARAETLFSTFGPGDSYLVGTGATISGPASILSSANADATAFSLAQAATVTSYDVALTRIAGADLPITFQLRANDAGAPGAVLDTFAVTSVAEFPGQAYTVLSTTNPTLNAGSTYWLYAETSGDLFGFWNYNSIGATGTRYTYVNGAGGASAVPQDLPTFRVNGTAAAVTVVPEPGTLALLPMGTLALAAAGASVRRRRKAGAAA